MITAEDAIKQTKTVISQLELKTMQWVDNEWEFVENTIKEAISNGYFETSYWWSNELLQEAGIRKNFAAEALATKAKDLGFDYKVYQNYSCSNVLRLELDWRKIKE